MLRQIFRCSQVVVTWVGGDVVFGFVAPYHDELTYNQERVLSHIREGLRPFVKVRQSVIRELVETKTPKILRELPDGEGWKVHYAFFARAGFTDAACAEAETVGAAVVVKTAVVLSELAEPAPLQETAAQVERPVGQPLV